MVDDMRKQLIKAMLRRRYYRLLLQMIAPGQRKEEREWFEVLLDEWTDSARGCLVLLRQAKRAGR